MAIDTRQEEVNVKEYFAKEIRTVLQRGGKRLKLETDTLKNYSTHIRIFSQFNLRYVMMHQNNVLRSYPIVD